MFLVGESALWSYKHSWISSEEYDVPDYWAAPLQLGNVPGVPGEGMTLFS